MRFSLLLLTLLAGCAAPGAEMPGPSAGGEAGYRAGGNEPGWAATVADGRMTLLLDYGERRIIVVDPQARTSFNGHRYTGPSSAGPVALDATHVLCKDGMSGRNFPDTVLLTVGGDSYRGCGGEPADVLAGEWRVIEIGGQPAAAGAQATLAFADGQVTGRALCNSFGGSFTLTGEGMAVGPLRSTRMGCAPPLMAQEARFLDILGHAARFDIGADRRLTIEASDGRTLVAVRGA